MPPCPVCNETISLGRRFCPHCRSVLEGPCPSCGAHLPGLLQRCPKCRTRLDERTIPGATLPGTRPPAAVLAAAAESRPERTGLTGVELGGAAAYRADTEQDIDDDPLADDTMGGMDTASMIAVPAMQDLDAVPATPAPPRVPFALRIKKPSADALLGQLLDGRYTIVERLGQGGMGTVYRGRQESMGRDVAIKVMRAACAENDQQVARFLAEARTASQLRHPNTVVVHDFGQTPDGLLYLVMELLVGRPLTHLVRDEGALPWPRALRILMQVLNSLAEAHDKGFLHRDVKPDNIMVGRLGDNPDFSKVLDFGIAKSLSAAGTGMTATGTVLGTPRYMSPEQATDRPVDPRADLYSLGVVLFEMLTGVPPFSSETPVALLLKHVTEPPPDIRTAHPNLDLPDGLHTLLGAMLAKNPSRRPADARVARRACEALLAAAGDAGGAPPAGASPPRQGGGRRVPRRGRRSGPGPSPPLWTPWRPDARRARDGGERPLGRGERSALRPPRAQLCRARGHRPALRALVVGGTAGRPDHRVRPRGGPRRGARRGGRAALDRTAALPLRAAARRPGAARHGAELAGRGPGG